MDYPVAPPSLTTHSPEDLITTLREKINSSTNPNFNVNAKNSIYGKVVQTVTNKNQSTIEERQYLNSLWRTATAQSNSKLTEHQRKVGKQRRNNSIKKDRRANAIADAYIDIRRDKIQNKLTHTAAKEEANGNGKVCTKKRLASTSQSPRTIAGGVAKKIREITKAFKRMSPGGTTSDQKSYESNPPLTPERVLRTCTEKTCNTNSNNLAPESQNIIGPAVTNLQNFPSSVIGDHTSTPVINSPQNDNQAFVSALLTDYEKRISIFPTFNCPVCHRFVYNTTNSTKSITISANLIIALQKFGWENAFEEDTIIRTCRRCHTALQKNKIPAMAYMNNMEPGDAPPQISKLNKIELRMISQVKPFMKIFNLSRGRGQQAIKGSVIHFAQNLNKIIKTLPITPNNTDLVLVNETDTDGWSLDDFFVQSDLLYDALCWLKRNNPLYNDVDILMPNDHELQIHEIRDVSNLNASISNVNHLSQPEFGFRAMINGHKILRADFHQGSVIFPNGGNQCAAMALSSIAHAFCQPCVTWTSTLMNSILLAGDSYYNTVPIHDSNGYLSASEVAGEIMCFEEIKVKVEIQERFAHGFLNIISKGELRLRLLEFIEEEYDFAMLTTNSYCVALIKQDENLFLFDSHVRGPNGQVPVGNQQNGSACIIQCPLTDAAVYFSTLIHRNLGYKINKPKQNITDADREKLCFSIRPFKCSVVLDDDGNQADNEDEPQHNQQCQQRTIYDQNLNFQRPFGAPTSLDCVITTDQPVEPELETFLEQMKINQPRCVIERPVIRPLYPNREPHLEELSFVKAFPFGKNGYDQERQIKITPLDYFQQRVMSSNKAFHDNEFLFYALSRVEQYTVQQKIAVCGNMRADGDDGLDNLLKGWDNVHLYMSAIRGSSSYWRRYTGDVLAMITQLSTPTFFYTISYDDLNSVDCLTALWKAEYGPDAELSAPPSDISFEDKRDLLNNNPIASARHFSQKMNVIMDILKKHSQTIFGAPLQNFTYRVEFQGRGSPHVHMLLWLEGVPEWNTEEGKQFLERNVSCSIDVPFKNLVHRYQNHNHTKTCFKKNNNICRFGFPRKQSAHTKVLDDDEITRNYGRFVDLKRTNQELMINNYHPILLQLFKCNQDIQAVTGSRAIAYYIGKYMSKAESPHLREEIKKSIESFKSDTNSSYHSKAMSIANKLISQREVSGPESAFRLCSLPLRKSSRLTIFVPAYLPQFRVRMLRQETIGQPKTLQGLNIFDRYVDRPDSYAHWSCIEFASSFTPVVGEHRKLIDDDLDENVDEEEQPTTGQIVLKNNKGRMHKRKNPAIIKFPFFNPTEQRENYLYCLILLYYPFTKEEDILHPINEQGQRIPRSIQKAFEDLSPHFRTSADNSIIRPDLLEQVNTVLFLLNDAESQSHNEDCEADEMDNNVFYEEQPEDINPNEIFVPEPNVPLLGENDSLQDSIRSLNPEQRAIFNKIRDKILNENARPQLLEFCQGSAGVGKSFLIHCLTLLIQTLCAGKERALIKGAPTGVAAKGINGSTIHKCFCLGVEKDGIAQYYPLGGRRLQERRNMFRQVKFIILDEISMISYQVLRTIHMRLCEILPQDDVPTPLPFGGINVILFGDILQISPCRGKWIFDRPPYLSYEQDLWKVFKFNELTTTVRQASTDPILPILMRLRIGTLVKADIEKLRERLLHPSNPNYQSMLAGSLLSIHLYPKVKMVEKYNSERIEALKQEGARIYTLKAQDTFADGVQFGKNVPPNAIPKDFRKCGGIPESLLLANDCKVMLKYNADVLGGMVNGALGIVKGFIWPAFRNTQRYEGHLPESVVVKFDGNIDERHLSKNSNYAGCVEVAPKSFEFVGNRGTRICRHQIPLVLCFSCSIHKSQGMSLDSVTVHLGTHLFKPGMSYVACSRVRTWSGLYITEIDPNKLLVNARGKGPCNEVPLKELYRLKLIAFLEENIISMSPDLFNSLLIFILEYVMCCACKTWICDCNCKI